MEVVTDEVLVLAPAEQIWQAILDPVTQAAWHPFITSIDGVHRLGAARTCTVVLDDRPSISEERCTAFEDGRSITWSVEKDTSGFSRATNAWQHGFTLTADGTERTRVSAQSSFRPSRPLIRVMNPIIRRRFHQTQRAVLAALKQYVESAA